MSTCVIRPYQAKDAQNVYEAVRESLGDLVPWMPWCHPDYSLEEARQWVSSQDVLAQRGLAYEFAILDDRGGYLGGCGINQLNHAHRFANLGYWVRSSAAGHGTAPAAARLAADYAFNQTALVRLEIVCAVDNLRSQRAAEKTGAVREGVLRSRLVLQGKPTDAVMYGIARPVQS
jgi:ribosomal-protein-serine acetyltransferase